LENVKLCREHYRLRIQLGHDESGQAFPPTLPGQFVQLGCRTPDAAMDFELLTGGEIEVEPGKQPALRQPELCGPLAMLRRPFSLAGRGDDGDGTWIELIHRVVGVGTAWLEQLQPGDAVDVIGPLGNAFALPASKSIGLMVGGGVGLPPMFYLAERLAAAGWTGVGFIGAMTRDLLAVTLNDQQPATDGAPSRSVAEFARHDIDAVLTTDDGSLGLAGRITDGLHGYLDAQPSDDRERTVIFTCGPEPMMHAVAKLAATFGVECQVCMEQAMACGMGTCQSCVVKIEDQQLPQGTTAAGQPWRYRLACTDGPVFSANDVVW